MLLLKDAPHRLSIDIDIICPPGTDIEDYLREYAAHGFIDYRLIERNTSLNISTRGLIDKDKFLLLQKGIKSISSFMYRKRYLIEDAIIDSAKAAYLSALLESGVNDVKHYNNDPASVAGLTTGRVLPAKLTKLRIGNPEAFFLLGADR